MEMKIKYVNENNPSSSSHLVHANNLCGVQAGASDPKRGLIASSAPRCVNNFLIAKASRSERGSSLGGDTACPNAALLLVGPFGTSDRLVSEAGQAAACDELSSSVTFFLGKT